jgi:hypothetical protein
MGCCGHDYAGSRTVIVDKRRRGETCKRIWPCIKRRAAVEPRIGHLKSAHRLQRDALRGTLGVSIKALLSAAAMNFSKPRGFHLNIWLALLDPLQPRRSRTCAARNAIFRDDYTNP